MSITKKELQQYRNVQIELQQLTDQIAALKKLLPKIPKQQSKESSPRKNQNFSPTSLTETTALITDLQDTYHTLIRQLFTHQRQIEAAIHVLAPVQRVLMRARYIEGKGWEEIAAEMHYSVQRVWQIHRETLKTLLICAETPNQK